MLINRKQLALAIVGAVFVAWMLSFATFEVVNHAFPH
jgi:hypothetical protein